jgi:hypothetical protein
MIVVALCGKVDGGEPRLDRICPAGNNCVQRGSRGGFGVAFCFKIFLKLCYIVFSIKK